MRARRGVLGAPDHWTDVAPRQVVFTRAAGPLERPCQRLRAGMATVSLDDAAVAG